MSNASAMYTIFQFTPPPPQFTSPLPQPSSPGSPTTAGDGVVATALDAADAKEQLIRLHPDLVFLDIQMPGTNGLELLQQLPDPHFELIFVTAHDQYGIQAVKFAAVDYLLKPIAREWRKDTRFPYLVVPCGRLKKAATTP